MAGREDSSPAVAIAATLASAKRVKKVHVLMCLHIVVSASKATRDIAARRSCDSDDASFETITSASPSSQDAAIMTVPVDPHMTVEGLRNAAWSLYTAHCRDSGVPFAPPSQRADDYDVRLASEDFTSIDTMRRPLVPSAEGGELLRHQLASTPPPFNVALVIGASWIQRNIVERAEKRSRVAIESDRDAFAAEYQYFFVVSKRKALERQRHRERHMGLVEQLEQAMFGALLKHHTVAAALESQKIVLDKTMARWAAHCVAVEREIDQMYKQKRMFLAGSGLFSSLSRSAVGAVCPELASTLDEPIAALKVRR